MIRIGICDDSSAFLHQTKFMIEHWDNRPSNITVDLFEEGDSLIQAHRQNPFSIILLDVIMPLLNGIEVAKVLRGQDKTVKIVFLTQSAEYAVDSYTVKANNYLLKPVDPDLLFACLEELLSEIYNDSRYITVKGIGTTHRIRLADIEYVESQRKHVVFFLTDGSSVVSLGPLYAYEDLLVLNDGFYKCHRSYIVNIQYIDSFSTQEIMMRSGGQLPISRDNQKDFESIYFNVLFGKAGDDK